MEHNKEVEIANSATTFRSFPDASRGDIIV